MATELPTVNLTIQVVYAEPLSVWRVTLCLPAGSTAGQAVLTSGFARQFPHYPQQALAIGVYGQTCTTERVLCDGDRVEIYRPLTFDPMQSRRRRAAHRKAFMTKSLRL